jgi:UDP-xylose/UDP-N-acetylglucosamine transporter B4
MISSLLQIFGGCCTNVLALELITKAIKNSINLITFCQFAFVAFMGFFTAFDFRLYRFKKTVIPVYHWMGVVIFFWSSSLLNNKALDYKISMRTLVF